MPLQIRRRPRVDDSHLPATLHPLLRQIFASRGVDDPALLERSASTHSAELVAPSQSKSPTIRIRFWAVRASASSGTACSMP